MGVADCELTTPFLPPTAPTAYKVEEIWPHSFQQACICCEVVLLFPTCYLGLKKSSVSFLHSSMKSVVSEMVNWGSSNQTVFDNQITQLKWQLQNSCFNDCSSIVKEDSVGFVSEDTSLQKDEGCGLKRRKVETEKPCYVCVRKVDNNETKKRKKHLVNPHDVSNNNNDNYKIEKEDLGERLNSVESEPAQKTEYIYVRARRGQATDSHSLAERVRREKISERMKYLQDLVPGCNKITGKACVLDEIINYVQSLQGQIEFLSMKRAATDPQIHCNILQSQSFMGKEINSSCSTSISRNIPSYLLTNPQSIASHCDLSINPRNLTDLLACHKILPNAYAESCFNGCGSSSWTSNEQELCNLDYSEGRECVLPFHLFQIENDLPNI